jgi:ATP phosphoribosyltransferase
MPLADLETPVCVDRPNPTPSAPATLRVGLPKGRMQVEVDRLLSDAGLAVRPEARGYRPVIDGLDGLEAKRLKPQAIVSMLAAGTRDLGFAGGDWVEELGVDLVEVMDTGLDQVRIVAAAPSDLPIKAGMRLRIASELPRIAAAWAAARGLEVIPVRSWGTTEVLPPEDADLIVDVVQTGATLVANGLTIVDVIRTSSTRLYASPEAMACVERRSIIERIVDLLRSVLEARARLLVELNVTDDRLDDVLAVLPCMRRPTVSRLAGDGYAVRAAVPRDGFPELIGRVRAAGGTDLVVSEPRQVIP